MQDLLIELKEVSKRFDKKVVLEDLNLEVYKQDFLGVIGVSGSGKTTLMKLIAGYLEPEKGTIIIGGKELAKNKMILNKEFGFASQEGSFYPDLTVKQNLYYFAKLYNLKEDVNKRIEEVLKAVELEDCLNEKAKNLSRGMQRRLDIACAIIHRPQILFLDEPTADLQPALRKKLLLMVTELNKKEGTTIVMTSQMIDEIESFCSRVAFLHNKKIIKIETLKGLISKTPKESVIIVKTDPGNYNRIITRIRKGEFNRVIKEEDSLVFHTTNTQNDLNKVISLLNKAKENIVDLKIKKSLVSEAFAKLVG